MGVFSLRSEFLSSERSSTVIFLPGLFSALFILFAIQGSAQNCLDFSISNDTIFETTFDCNSNTGVCLPLVYDNRANYSFTDNGQEYTTFLPSCADGGVFILDTGYHEFIIWDNVQACGDTAHILIECLDCPFIYDGPVSYELDDCSDSLEVCLNIPYADRTNYDIEINTELFSGNLEPCITDSTLFYDVSDLTVGPFFINGWTIDNTPYSNAVGSIMELSAFMSSSDPYTDWTYDSDNNIIFSGPTTGSYGSLTVQQSPPVGPTFSFSLEKDYAEGAVTLTLGEGEHEFFITNNDNGCQDLFNINISCPEDTSIVVNCPSYYSGPEEYDLLNCEEVQEICLDFMLDSFNLYTVLLNGQAYDSNRGWNNCSMSNLAQINLDPGDYEMVIIYNSNSCRDTHSLLINCPQPEPWDSCTVFSNSTRTIMLDQCGDTALICLEVPIDSIDFWDLRVNDSIWVDTLGECATSDTSIAAQFLEGTYRLTAAKANCVMDTMMLTVDCIPIDSTPVARDDAFDVMQDAEIQFLEILLNDMPMSDSFELSLVQSASLGTSLINTSNELAYTPQPGYCNNRISDTLMYSICSDKGCDTAKVMVTIQCPEITVANGFSPNGDGVNEALQIVGLGDEVAELLIFNRWGNKIYESTDYQNDWQGDFQGSPLPDGTYFYQLNLSTGETQSGYLLIQR